MCSIELTLELRMDDNLYVAVWQAVSNVSISAKVDLTFLSCSEIIISTHVVCLLMSCNESCAGTILFVLRMHGANTIANALELILLTSSCKATL